MSVVSLEPRNSSEESIELPPRTSIRKIIGGFAVVGILVALGGALISKTRDNHRYRARMAEQVAIANTIIRRDWPTVQTTINTLCPTENLYNLPNTNKVATIGTVGGERGNFPAPTESLRNCIISTQIPPEQRCVTIRRVTAILTRLHTVADTANNFTGISGSQKRWFYSVVRATEFLDEAIKRIPLENTCSITADAGITIATSPVISGTTHITSIPRNRPTSTIATPPPVTTNTAISRVISPVNVIRPAKNIPTIRPVPRVSFSRPLTNLPTRTHPEIPRPMDNSLQTNDNPWGNLEDMTPHSIYGNFSMDNALGVPPTQLRH